MCVFLLVEFFSILPWRIGVSNSLFSIMCFLLYIPYSIYRYKLLKKRVIRKMRMQIFVEITLAILFNLLTILLVESIATIEFYLLQSLSIAPTILFEFYENNKTLYKSNH